MNDQKTQAAETHREMVSDAYAHQPTNISMTFTRKEEGENSIEMCEALAGEAWEKQELRPNPMVVTIDANTIQIVEGTRLVGSFEPSKVYWQGTPERFVALLAATGGR